MFGSWDPCDSPTSYSGLEDGDYAFETRARDGAGNLDLTPATRAWTVGDITSPTSRAPARSLTAGTTLGTSTVPLRLRWSATDDRTSGSALRYDLEQRSGASTAWTRVLSNSSATDITRSLGAGTYQFRVRARDAAGN